MRAFWSYQVSKMSGSVVSRNLYSPGAANTLDCEALALIYIGCEFWKGTDATSACNHTVTDAQDARV